MEQIVASILWAPERDSLYVLREPPVQLWQADPFDGYPLGCVLMELDENEDETGRIAGVEIIGFVDFDKWESVPQLPMTWRYDDWEPLPLAAFLMRLQAELRKQAKAGAA